MAGYIGSKVAVVSSGAERKKVFTATSGQTSFTGLSYTVNNVHVFQNGVRLVDGTDYTATNGNSITLTVGAATDDQVVVVSYNTFQTSDTVSASTGGTFAGDVNFTGAFTSQGIDDNASSTAMTLDGSGNLLVGQSSTTVPGAGNTTAGTSIRGTDGVFISRTTSDTSASALQVNKNTGQGAIINIASGGTTVGSIGSEGNGGTFFIGSGDVTLGFNAASDIIIPRGTNAANRTGAIDLGNANNRFKDLYLSGGVYLGGTGSANKLDDYEEGTWTPTFSSGTATTIGQATYTKIGRSVTLCVENLKPSDTTSGNTVQIQSLPFAPASGVGGSMGSIMAQYRDDDVGISCYIPNNASEIRIYETSVTGGFSALSHAGMFNNSLGAMYFTITYFTT